MQKCCDIACGDRWRIVRRRAELSRWVEHSHQQLYVWMVEPPRWKDQPITLYSTFEAARLAFAENGVDI